MPRMCCAIGTQWTLLAFVRIDAPLAQFRIHELRDACRDGLDPLELGRKRQLAPL